MSCYDMSFISSHLSHRYEMFSVLNVLAGWFMVSNATFNNITVISWWSVLLVDETGVPGENHRSVASQIILYPVYLIQYGLQSGFPYYNVITCQPQYEVFILSVTRARAEQLYGFEHVDMSDIGRIGHCI